MAAQEKTNGKRGHRLTPRLARGDLIKSVVVNADRIVIYLQRGQQSKRCKIMHRGSQAVLENILEQLIALTTPPNQPPRYGENWLENLRLLSPSKMYYDITAQEIEESAADAEEQDAVLEEIKSKIVEQ